MPEKIICPIIYLLSSPSLRFFGFSFIISLTAASPENITVNASLFTQEELTEKMHNYELETSGYTVWCVDMKHSGIGSNSCGPALKEKYQVNDAAFTAQVRFIVE